jgi:hypothetical protein
MCIKIKQIENIVKCRKKSKLNAINLKNEEKI